MCQPQSQPRRLFPHRVFCIRLLLQLIEVVHEWPPVLRRCTPTMFRRLVDTMSRDDLVMFAVPSVRSALSRVKFNSPLACIFSLLLLPCFR